MPDPSFFEKCSLTQELNGEEREKLANLVTLQTFKAKKVIIWEGVKDDRMYFVKSGRVIVSKKLKGKIEEVLTRFGPGDFFGELAVIEHSVRTATVEAEEDSELIIFGSKQLDVLEKDFPRIASKFYRALLLEMMKRLEKTTEKLQEAVIWGIEASSLDEKEFM